GTLPGGDPDLGVGALAGFFHEQKLRGIAGDGKPGVDQVGQASRPVFFLADARAGLAQSGIESATHLAKIAGVERGEVAPTDRYRLPPPSPWHGFSRPFANGAGHVV